MEINQYKTIGVMGGMGPEATAQLFTYIVKNTPAKRDQEHIPIIINNMPQIPDRTQALIYGGKSPVPALVEGIKKLENAGADFIIIPCNTSHAFIKEIQEQVQLPIVNMILETVTYTKRMYPNTKKMGLLATTGTIETHLYQNAFEKEHIQIMIPNEDEQKNLVMESIYGKMGIKTSFNHEYPRKLLLKMIQKFRKNGCDAVIMGCTEIPVVLSEEAAIHLINPTKILALKAIEIAKSNKSVYFHIPYLQFNYAYREEMN